MIFLGWVFNQIQTFSNSLFSLMCLWMCMYMREREAKKETESESVLELC